MHWSLGPVCRPGVVALGLWLGLLGGAPASAGARPAFTASERALCDRYLAVCEHAVDAFAPLWRDAPGMPNAGFFDFSQYDNWKRKGYGGLVTIPGNGMVALAYAVLLTETDKDTFGQQRVPRATLLERAVKAIRWCCLTSADAPTPHPYLSDTDQRLLDGAHWRRTLGFRADIAGYLTVAVAVLWDHLDKDTRDLFEAVAAGGAARERQVRVWNANRGGNHDQVKQDLSSTVGAAYLFPTHKGARLFRQAVVAAGIDMVSTEHDRARAAVAEGKPVADWAEGWNLYPDYSSDHHHRASVWYGGDMLFEGRCYVEILARATGANVPATYTYPGNGFDGVCEWLKALCLAEGALAHPHGAEYDSYYGAGLLAFCYGATVNQDPVAAALEHQAASLLQRHTRAVGQYDYHRGSWAKAAMAYLMHRHHAPAAEPMALADALQALEGTRHYERQRCVVHRTRDKWVSFSWGSSTGAPGTERPCGFVVPQRQSAQASAPLIYCDRYSLTGDLDAETRPSRARVLLRRLIGAPVWALGLFVAGVVAQVLLLVRPMWRRRRWARRARLAVGAALCALLATALAGALESAKQESTAHTAYAFHRSDDGFSTAGWFRRGPVVQHQAFFSFAAGPCATWVVLRAVDDTRAKWSGMRTEFFAREGLAAELQCAYQGGKRRLAGISKQQSPWWCVNDRLGMVVLGGTGEVRSRRNIGENWARTKRYRDLATTLSVSRVKSTRAYAGAVVADVGAVLYVETPAQQVAECLADTRDISPQLPDGWRGLTAPVPGQPGTRLLAVANLYGEAAEEELRLSFPQGAPVLREATQIEGSTALATLRLAALGSLRETLAWYVTVLDGASVVARRRAPHRVELQPSAADRSSRVRLRYAGAAAERVVVRDAAGAVVAEAAGAKARDEGVECTVRGTVVVAALGGAADRVGPAVQIQHIQARGDTLIVSVHADDQSGVANVALYCDDVLVGEKAAPPYDWAWPAAKGWHRVHAVATDGAARPNAFTSFARTVCVGTEAAQ